jgi:aminotransferase
MVPDRAQQKAWAGFAREHDLWIISDEIYAELTFDGQGFESMASLPDMKERTLVVTGVSKAFAMTGWRLGIAAGPEALIGRMCKIHQYAMLCAPIMSQYAAIEAFNQGEKIIKDMRDSYRYRRNYFVTALKQMGLEAHQPGGAFYAFPSIRLSGLSSRDFAMGLLKEHSVAVVPGTAFGSCGEGYIRCCYATAFNDLKEAARRMAAFVGARLK